MKFIKGMLIGGAIGAGMAMMYEEGIIDKRKIMKKGKQVAKIIGML